MQNTMDNSQLKDIYTGRKERFEKDLKVTMQALSWRSAGRYLPLQDDVSSVAFWYQKEPHAKFPKLPSKDELEIR